MGGLRYLALLVAGAFTAHELRFLAAYSHDGERILSEHGHEYLPLAEVFALVLVAAALGQFALSAAHARRGLAPARALPSFARLWLRTSAALVAIYAVQESLEGAFAPGHPVWSHGGWTIVPLALAIGAAIAALMHGASRALTVIAAGSRSSGRPRPASAPTRFHSRAARPRASVLARNLACRAPPLTGR